VSYNASAKSFENKFCFLLWKKRSSLLPGLPDGIFWNQKSQFG
jgi:hypothetical protein